MEVERRAIIIDALSLDRPNPEFTESAVASLKSAEFEVNMINGSDVTVGALKKLPSGYGIVVMRLHSEAFMNQVFLFTAEPSATSSTCLSRCASRSQGQGLEASDNPSSQ